MLAIESSGVVGLRLTKMAFGGPSRGCRDRPARALPQGCIYRSRALEAVEASGRRWRAAFVGQGLAGVQAAIASGIGVGLLAEDAVQPDHRRLGPQDGFMDPPPSELALIGPRHRMAKPVAEVAEFLIRMIGTALP